MTSRKTIMHLIATNFYGGPEKQILEHLKRLDQKRYVGKVASFLEGDMTNELITRAKKENLITHEIPMSGAVDVRALWHLIKLLQNEKVELLCAHGYKSAVLGWLAGRKQGVPVLVFSRGYTAENRKVAFYEWLERQVLGKVEGIVAVSNGQMSKLHSYGIQGQNEWVVHNAVETEEEISLKQDLTLREEVCSRFGMSLDDKIIVTAGRLSPEKGHRYLIESITGLKERNENLIFIFCGEGPCESELRKQADRIGVIDKCRFVGFRHDIKDLFQVMDLFVLPSLTEGLPNVILEAFSYGKPVISTSVGGVPEVVSHMKNGILIDAGDVTQLTNAIDICLDSPEFMCQLGKAGFNTVKNEFAFEQQAQKL